ncbi:Fc.00g058220.m01.CDS01 [Cosmosporella sp. VM-42]
MKRTQLTSQSSIQQLITSLSTHRINTLTELCRIERTAASCTNETDARAFQEPMTSAWVHYVTSNQFLTELRGLTQNYPFSGTIVEDAYARVRADPQSNRSWNLAWLCLMKMREDGMVAEYAASEAMKQEMWGDMVPTEDEVKQLAACFEYEWNGAVDTMLRHWTFAPTWY